MEPIVISLFDYTGNAVRPWAEAGYICYCVDIKHEPGNRYTEWGKGRIYYLKRDILQFSLVSFHGQKIACMLAFPPCTDLAVSGARHFKDKGLFRLAKAIELFGKAVELCEESEAPYAIENPRSTISTYYRKPDFSFDPCDYGDPYTKRTFLWTGGGFVMPPKNPVFPTEGSKMHKLSPSKERATIRSTTPMGFARAVFASNSKLAEVNGIPPSTKVEGILPTIL